MSSINCYKKLHKNPKYYALKGKLRRLQTARAAKSSGSGKVNNIHKAKRSSKTTTESLKQELCSYKVNCSKQITDLCDNVDNIVSSTDQSNSLTQRGPSNGRDLLRDSGVIAYGFTKDYQKNQSTVSVQGTVLASDGKHQDTTQSELHTGFYKNLRYYVRGNTPTHSTSNDPVRSSAVHQISDQPALTNTSNDPVSSFDADHIQLISSDTFHPERSVDHRSSERSPSDTELVANKYEEAMERNARRLQYQLVNGEIDGSNDVAMIEKRKRALLSLLETQNRLIDIDLAIRESLQEKNYVRCLREMKQLQGVVLTETSIMRYPLLIQSILMCLNHPETRHTAQLLVNSISSIFLFDSPDNFLAEFHKKLQEQLRTEKERRSLLTSLTKTTEAQKVPEAHQLLTSEDIPETVLTAAARQSQLYDNWKIKIVQYLEEMIEQH